MTNWRKLYTLYVGHWNSTTDLLYNPRNAERIPFSSDFLSQNFVDFDIVKSSRYILRDRSHYRNRIEFGRHCG